jgi:hypothetical protein
MPHLPGIYFFWRGEIILKSQVTPHIFQVTAVLLYILRIKEFALYSCIFRKTASAMDLHGKNDSVCQVRRDSPKKSTV